MLTLTVVAKVGHGQMKQIIAIQIGINGSAMTQGLMNCVPEYHLNMKMVHGWDKNVVYRLLTYVKRVSNNYYRHNTVAQCLIPLMPVELKHPFHIHRTTDLQQRRIRKKPQFKSPI